MALPWYQRLALWPLRQVWRQTRGVTLGVRVAVLDPTGRVLLVRHTYLPGWHFPGGGVDRGESIEAACRREVQEETGLTVIERPELIGLYTNFEAFPGDHVAFFVVRGTTGTLLAAADREIRDRAFFPTDALPDGTTAGTRRRLGELVSPGQRTLAW
jgi:ADP-ribose pyrophosphatase YjhB (NUDIX family)